MAEELGSLKDAYVTLQNGKKALAVSDGGQNIDVIIGDQTSRSLVIPFSDGGVGATTVDAISAIDQRVLNVASTTGFSVGSVVVLLGPSYVGFYQVTGINAGVSLVLDKRLDIEAQVGFEIFETPTNMNIDGSITPVIFRVRGPSGTFDYPFRIDITRIHGILVTNTTPVLTDFGDITDGIENGLILRVARADGTFENYGNFKNNADITLLGDVHLFDNGADRGFSFTIALAGQQNRGVAIRLDIDDGIEAIVQDDLTDLLGLKIVAIGHIVED